jgi:hypothetical protein
LAASRAKEITGHVVLPVPLLPFSLGVLLVLGNFGDEFDVGGCVVVPCSISPIENKLF